MVFQLELLQVQFFYVSQPEDFARDEQFFEILTLVLFANYTRLA